MSLELIRKSYRQDRVSKLDPIFLKFEEDMISSSDLGKLTELVNKKISPRLPNPHNSCILYALGYTDQFDFMKGRSDSYGGAAPD